jgi:hypothetical protein
MAVACVWLTLRFVSELRNADQTSPESFMNMFISNRVMVQKRPLIQAPIEFEQELLAWRGCKLSCTVITGRTPDDQEPDVIILGDATADAGSPRPLPRKPLLVGLAPQLHVVASGPLWRNMTHAVDFWMDRQDPRDLLCSVCETSVALMGAAYGAPTRWGNTANLRQPPMYAHCAAHTLLCFL